MKPRILIKPPGPKAAKIIRRDENYISPCLTRSVPLVIDRTYGVNIDDVDGNRYLDFGAGISVANVGWNNPEVVNAVRKQMEKAAHTGFADFYADAPVTLAEKLISLVKTQNTVFYTNSGAETIEAAMKLARRYTGRKYFISFYNSFHGRTYGALSLTAAKIVQREGFGPFLSTIHVPYPDSYRPQFENDEDGMKCLEYLENVVFRKEVSPTEVAALFIEHVQGEGGYIVPPKRFVQELRKLCKDYGILYVADEIQSGMFRTGKFLAGEHFGVDPDIICIAKSLSGGLVPIGVCLSNKKISGWKECVGAYSGTFGGNLLSCTAGLATLNYMTKNKLAKRAEQTGKYIMNRMKEWEHRYRVVGDVRGLGMMIGIEIIKDKKTKKPGVEEREKIVNKCFENGLVLIPAGQSTIRIIPALTIEREDVDIGLDILEKEIKKV